MTDNVKHNELTLLELCTLLKQITVLKELSILQLSESCGSSYPALVKLLNGNNENPTLKTLEIISNELGYSVFFNLKKKEDKKSLTKRGKKP